MRYEQAKQYAEEIQELLKPYCKRIEIAGGVRRKKEEPHDIEIVCNPNKPPYFLATMQRLHDEGHFTYGNPSKNGAKAPFGEKYYRIKYKGEPLDVFVVSPPANFNVIYLLRTGDANFSHSYVTFLHTKGMKCIDGRIIRTESKEEVPIESEEECFRIIGKDWIKPEKRIGTIV